MENKINLIRKETIKQSLNGIVLKETEIKRQDILEAEEISYNNNILPNLVYDEYGFINHNKGNSNKKE